MFRYIIISTTMERIPNPLVIEIRQQVRDLSPDITYLIHTADLAADLYQDFNYLSNRLRSNVYWFEHENELDRIILETIKTIAPPSVITNVADVNFTGEIFYTNQDGRAYILNDGSLFHVDFNIVSRLNRQKIDMDYLLETPGIGARQMRIVFKELGLLDETYSEEGYMSYLRRFGMEHVLPHIYKVMWDNRPHIVYDLEEPYDNPYENILFVEEYLTNQPVHNLDVDKFEAYDLKHGKLPARYVYRGFHTTTGRIYCNSDEWASLPNLTHDKRDVLYALPGHHLIEFDFKSFEFDILCQILGIEVEDDPHTEVFQKVVGVDAPNGRSIGKTINYSFIYGSNEGRLADQILNDVPELPRSFRETILERLAELPIMDKKRDLEENLRSTARNGVIQNYFCRNIYFKKEHAILNNYISSTAADFLYVKFRQVADMLGDGGTIILENHDSILMHLKDSFIESDRFDQMIAIMRSPVSGLVGRIDIKYGQDWKNMQ